MAQVITVTDTASLTRALSSAQGGDTILLQSGTYSGLSLQSLNFGSGITVTSADPAHQAVITNFNMSNIQGLTFSHLDFQVLTPAFVGFNVYSSQHITFDQVHMYGPAGLPDPNAEGIRFFDSAYLTFSNSEVEQVAHGVSFARSDHITVSGNNIHNVSSDTLNFAQVSYVHVTGNALHDFYPTDGAHPDAMQFGTANSTVGSHDITISDNLIYRGAGQNSQGIFMRDEVGDIRASNFTITNNVVVGTGSSGIRPTSVDNVVVTGNQLISFAGGDVTNILLQNDTNATLSNNTAASIGYPTVTGLTETGDVANAAKVTDNGAAAIQQWMTTHTEDVFHDLLSPAISQTQADIATPPVDSLAAAILPSIDMQYLNSFNFELAFM